ncbi:MAG: LysM peptidoglycan-binding domain-containing protein, partial [Bacteroidales bacterium]|nr:LysM peptidoglycan-binding domain-containing protein [Bacteroidales bacterium]
NKKRSKPDIISPPAATSNSAPARVRATDRIVKREHVQTIPHTRWETKTVMKSKMTTERIRKIRLQPKYYKVKAGDYPIHIAKRFGLSLEQLLALNNADAFPLQGGQSIFVGRIDEEYYVDTLVRTEFPVDTLIEINYTTLDTLEFLDTIEIFEETVPVSDEKFIKLENNPVQQMDSISRNFDDIYNEALSKVQAYERSVANLIKYKNKDESNYIYSTLQSSNPVYSVSKISKIKANRMQNSDLLRLTFESHDQGVCQQTLKIITEVSKREHQSIKGTQATLVSDYFREQRDIAKRRLDSLEVYNEEYRVKHSIINYNEQTKFVAEQNEVLERDWYDEYANLSAAKAALYSLESEMDIFTKNLTEREELVDLRDELSRLTALISIARIGVEPDLDVIDGYIRDKEQVQRDMDKFLLAAFKSKRTTEGIEMQGVLGKWMEKLIAVEESKAKYDVKSDQKLEYKLKYDLYAPLGSTITKIEREIDLAEQIYLNQTHSLDLSLMKQKNNEQSNIRTLDEPYFPIKPNSSKRMFIIIAAFMAGLFLTTGVIILLEFIDTSIKFPERAEELTKNKLIGAFPKISTRPQKDIDYPQITARLIDMISQKIKLAEIQRPAIDKPYMVLFLSTRPYEGKTFIASKLVDKFRAVGHRVLYVKPFENSPKDEFEEQFRSRNEENPSWDFEYEIPDNFISINNVNELLRNYTFITKGYQYIFVELPALLRSDYPPAFASDADLSLLVCRATRTWNKADDEVLDVYRNNAKQTIYSLLNGVQVDNLTGIIGEIPKNRSFVRIFVKKLINFNVNIAKALNGYKQ